MEKVNDIILGLLNPSEQSGTPKTAEDDRDTEDTGAETAWML